MLKANCIAYKSKNLWKRGILLLFVISFFSLFSLGITPEAEGQDAPKDYSELLFKAQAAGSVRIIVKLDMPFVPEGLLSAPQEAVDQQARISRMQDQLLKALSKYNVKGIKRFKHMPYIAMEADSTALKVLISNPLVISIEEDVPVPPTLNQSIPLINADDAWTLGYTGSGWAVAILDTGVDKTHSFFSGGKVVAEACFSTTYAPYSTTVCPNGLGSQTGSGAGVNCSATIYGCDHGTHVAGIAAGKSATINGVAKDANIIAVQIFSKFNSATYCGADTPCALSYTSDQIEGLEHVYSLRTTYNIAAVNMSLGGGAYSSYCDSSQSATKAAIDNLLSAGIATVISSGNDSYCGYISEPACISTAVSVGATTKSDQEAIYNNYASILALFAPGSSIYSSIPGNSWKSYSGTSMAAPHVTGAWAILKQAFSSASVPTILSAFQNTGVSIADTCSGSGYYPQRRIDVLAALNSLIAIPPSLQGTVTSAFTTKPIANARINLNPPYTTALTDSSGFYQYLNLPAITYDVTASAFRYTASTANSVSVPPSGTVTQDFSLACNASFTDVSPGYWAENYIKEMYCRSITAGCSTSPLKYCPENMVTRAVMAKFIIRGMGETPSAVAYNTYFDDIANDLAIDGFAGYINRMWELGITTGCGTRLYCPSSLVSRAQMAVFIIRAF